MADLYNQLVSDTPIQYGQVQYFEPLNDAAIDETWKYVVPPALKGAQWFNGIRPYLGDIWKGLDLFIRKPYDWMSTPERNQYANKGAEYFKSYMVGRPVNTKFGTYNFYGNRAYETNPRYMNQYPFVRYKLSKAKKNTPTPNYKPDERNNTERFNNLEINFGGKKYVYQGRYNKNYKTNDFYNIREDAKFRNDIETKLRNDKDLNQKFLDMQKE